MGESVGLYLKHDSLVAFYFVIFTGTESGLSNICHLCYICSVNFLNSFFVLVLFYFEEKKVSISSKS